MPTFINLMPGETRSCIGCHESRASTHGGSKRPSAMLRGPESLDPPPWGTGPISYQQVVQPVLDAKCIRCHDAKHKRKINLTGKLDKDRVPTSYRTLVAGGLVHYFNTQYGQMHKKADPLTFGSVKSKLIKTLESRHPSKPLSPKDRVKLTRDEMRRIKCWIDMNCPLWGDYTYRLNRPTKLAKIPE